MKILVIQQKMIGDVLVSSLLCEHLKIHIPHAEVHYLVNEHTVAVVEENPFIDKIVLFKKEHKSNKVRFYRFLKSISKERYDAVIDIYGKLESNLITLFSAAKIKIAYPKWYSKFIYTHHVPIKSRTEGSNHNTIDDRLGLLSPLIDNKLDPMARPKIHLTPKELGEAKTFLEKSRTNPSAPLIMLGVLGSGESKTYPLPYMAEVLDIIADRLDAVLLFNYVPSQEKEAKQVYALCNESTKQKIAFDTFAPSLRKFLGILHHCNALIGNEGGAVNMAKALGVPTFSIFSPWISKIGWHTYADEKNIGVHLNDYKEGFFMGKSKKDIKKDVQNLYSDFHPSLFNDELNTFLKLVNN